jgi:hypothetical protein
MAGELEVTVPPGSQILRAFHVEVAAGIVVETCAVRTPSGAIVIPVAATTPWGGYVKAMIEVDEETYQRAIAAAKRYDLIPRISAALQNRFGVGLEIRPILAR